MKKWKQKCDFGVGDRVAIVKGTNVGTVLDVLKSNTQEGPRQIRTLLFVRWDKDKEHKQPWDTWEEEYNLDYERSETVTTNYEVGDVVEGNLSGCSGVVDKVNNAHNKIEYYINWTADIPNSWESKEDLDSISDTVARRAKKQKVWIPEDEESTMTEEFMEELRTISLGEVMGVLVSEHGMAELLAVLSRHCAEDLDFFDNVGDRP